VIGEYFSSVEMGFL